MFKGLLKKAAKNASVYNISCDITNLRRVFPSDRQAASKHLLSYIENVFLAMEHSATPNELIANVENQLGENCNPALKTILLGVIQATEALRRKDKELMAANAEIIDSIFREQTGGDISSATVDLLTKYFK